MLQLQAQTDAALWERRHIIEEPPPTWLATHIPAGAPIGYDPLLSSEEGLQRYLDSGLAMIAVAANPIDAIWTDRPAPPSGPAVPHPLAQAGRDSAAKCADLAAALREAKQDAAILTDPASIAWLLNIRGDDVPYTPFVLGFAILHADGGTELFMAPEKLPAATRAWLGEAVAVQPRSALPAALARLAGRRVRVDAATAPVWFAQTLRAAGATVVAGMDPCLLPKASKNPVEQQGARDAHARDAVAVCRFLHWLDTQAGPPPNWTPPPACSLSAPNCPNSAARAFRRFPALASTARSSITASPGDQPADQPGRALPDRFRRSVSRRHHRHHPHGLDRPGHPPAELRDRVTRVLKGHIAIAALVFPQGVAGPHLDAFARAALWRAGLDYDHGTGHGVGSYLSVHEGPVSSRARPSRCPWRRA